ncbi:esterase D, partial [Aureobasidium melanogenum]
MSVKTTATIASFGGKLLKLAHKAASTNCEMKFNLFLPPQALKSSASKIPVLIYLSGLTCTGDNCSEKGFFQHRASQKGIAVVYPDTSPRGLGIPGEDDSYDFGSGAGFYVNATKEPYNKGYNMYSYITEDLPKALFSSFKQLDSDRVSITGHSMGGHGALTLFLKNPGKYKSVSAFAPIANPSNCDWGKKAFSGYFGEDQKEKWAEHDATELIKKWKGPLDMLIDVGTGDNFYKQGQLLPENLTKAAQESGNDKGVNLRMQPDYDHSYYFMATFADDHVDHAAKYLLGYASITGWQACFTYCDITSGCAGFSNVSQKIMDVPWQRTGTKELPMMFKYEGCKKSKTYSSRDSHVVTHRSTNLPFNCLCMAERTGCPVFS